MYWKIINTLVKSNFTHPILITQQVLIQRKPEDWRKLKKRDLKKQLLQSPLDLVGKTITVSKGSSFYPRIKSLSNEIGGKINVNTVSGENSMEELIEQVSTQEIEYTIADRNLAIVSQWQYPNIDAHLTISLDQNIEIIVKPHPACPIRLEDFPNLSGELSIKPIEELLKISDAIYTSLITSAAIDGYCIGLPVITILNGVTLNMSPLRGVKSVYFVKNSSELSSAINSIESSFFDAKAHYFYLDPNLPRWQKWLNDDSDKNNKL